MAKRRCAACGCLFEPRRNVPQQSYCSKRACQRTRRRRWREHHRAYWRDYRQRHPDATARNREQQRERNRRRRMAGTGPSPPVIANMDAYHSQKPVRSGTYRLVPVAAPGVAKMDAYLVEMHVLSDG